MATGTFYPTQQHSSSGLCVQVFALTRLPVVTSVGGTARSVSWQWLSPSAPILKYIFYVHKNVIKHSFKGFVKIIIRKLNCRKNITVASVHKHQIFFFLLQKH